jgi:hypothetical protein
VVLAEETGSWLAREGYRVTTTHRDMDAHRGGSV